VFVHGKPFQPGLMSVCKAGTHPIEEPFRCSTIGYAPGLANKQYTRLEWLTMDKHSSLSRKLVNYREKSFITLTPGHKTDSNYSKKQVTLRTKLTISDFHKGRRELSGIYIKIVFAKLIYKLGKTAF
jgi:hypothetical protein